jgi:hypothetical protein
MTVYTEESILILCNDETDGISLRTDLGTSIDGLINIKTKYYDSRVPVLIRTSVDENIINHSVKAIVIVDNVNFLKSVSQLVTEEDDTVKLFYTNCLDHIDICIENGFELVSKSRTDVDDSDFGIQRIQKALEARVWSSVNKQTQEEDLNIEQFDFLMSKLKNIRESCDQVSDDERRNRAAEVAFELAKLLGDDSDDSSHYSD